MPNTNILLSVLQNGKEKGSNRLHTVGLLRKKRRKKEEESGRMV